MVLWHGEMPANPQNIKLYFLQKRAIRAINKANYNSHTEPLLSKHASIKFTVPRKVLFQIFRKYAFIQFPQNMETNGLLCFQINVFLDPT